MDIDKEKLKQFWRKNDVPLTIGALGISMIVVSGMASGIIASRMVRRHPVRLQFVLTPEFLSGVQNVKLPTMSYKIRSK